MINPCFKEIKNFEIQTSDLGNKSNLEASEIEKIDVKINIFIGNSNNSNIYLYSKIILNKKIN